MAEKLAPLGEKKMTWHIILIYVVLWLMAIMDLINGLKAVFGVEFANTPDGGVGILRMYDGSNPQFALYGQHARIFILDGVFLLMMCMFIVFVRFQLAGMKRRGPILLMVVFGLNIVESLVYVGALYVFAPELVPVYQANTPTSLLANNLGNAAISAFVAGLTWVYYQRRREMFTK